MSKLGSAPPPPPYKVPLSERLFGIGKLRPPVTDAVAAGADVLPAAIRLGDYSLAMDAHGQWHMSSAMVSMYQQQITALEAKVAQLEDERLGRNVFELEKSAIALEREKLALMDENAQLKFKNKVLMAMCTIAEGDYKALCKEAGIEPRSQKKPAPAPAPAVGQSIAGGSGGMAPAQSPGPFQPQQSPMAAAYGQAQPAVHNTAASPMGAPHSQQQQQAQYSQQAPPTGAFMRAATVPGGMPSQTPYPQQQQQPPQLQQQQSLPTRR